MFLCMQILDDDGIAAPGEIIRPFDIYINKQTPMDTKSGGRSHNSVALKDRFALRTPREYGLFFLIGNI